MREIEPGNRTPELVEQLLRVWEGSVRATHLFLSEGEIERIRTYVPAALLEAPVLVVEESASNLPAAFMGISGRKLEMLFVSQNERGRGIGKRLLQRGIATYGVTELDVNEQNPQARGFYERMGFAVMGRSELDEQGNPYPILHMRLASAAAPK